MSRVSYSLALSGDNDGADIEALAKSPNGALHKARLEWLASEWKAYDAGLLHKRERRLDFAVDLVTHDPGTAYFRDQVQLVLDQTLLTRMFVLYGTHGWAAMSAMLQSLSSLDEHGRALVRATLVRVESVVVPQLVYVERDVAALARKEVAEQRKQVDAHLGRFDTSDPKRHAALRIANLDGLLALLKEARKRQNKVLRLEAKLSERRTKDGGDARTVRNQRDRDAYRRILFETYAGPQRVEIQALVAIQEQMAAIFAPSLLILNELEADLEDWLSVKDFAASTSQLRRQASIDAQHRYEGKMRAALAGLSRQLSDVEGSLANPGLAAQLWRYLDRPPMERWKQGGPHAQVIAECLRDLPSFRQFGKAIGTQDWLRVWELYEGRRDYFQVNRVMGRVGCLQRLHDRVLEEARGSLRQAVLKQYLFDLEREVARRQADEDFEASVWHAVEVGLALGGLLVALVSLPLGAGAVGVPAAVGTLLSVASMTLCVFTVVVMARSLARMMEMADRADAELMVVLVNLGQTDPDALAELGRLMVRQRQVSKALGPGVLRTLGELALASKLKPVAYALDLRGHLDDMETLGMSL